MIFPLICLIIFGGLEVTGQLSAVQASNFLSSEVAKLALRTCPLDYNAATSPSGTGTNADTCLKSVLDEFQQQSGNASLYPNTQYVLSLYNLDAGGNPVRTGFLSPSGAATKYSTSNFTSNVGAVNSALKSSLQNLGIVVISEVYLPLESVSGSVPRFWSYSYWKGSAMGSKGVTSTGPAGNDSIYASTFF